MSALYSPDPESYDVFPSAEEPMVRQNVSAEISFSGNECSSAESRGRRPYSTTSSVYAEHTLSNPNNDQVIYCIGAILQAQIFDNYINPEHLDLVVEEFEVEILLPPELGGPTNSIPEEVLNHETLNDLELRDKLIDGVVPTVDTMYKFIKMMIMRAGYSIECNILALVYITRITSQHKLALTVKNWRGLWISSVILAQKVWDDIPVRTSAFASILPNLTKDHLRKMEMKAFSLLDFCTTVKPSVYAKYYFELRQLFFEISGGDPRYIWNLQPLSVVQAKRLDDRSGQKGQLMQRIPSSTASSRAPSATSTPAAASVQASPGNYVTVDDMIPIRSRYVIS